MGGSIEVREENIAMSQSKVRIVCEEILEKDTH